MKKARRIIALFLALAMLLTLAACGIIGRKNEPATVGEPEVIDYPGYYVLTSMNGEDLSSYTTMYLVLNEDGTGYAHSMDGETSDITWDFDKITWWGEDLHFTVDADSLTMTGGDGETLVFARSSEKPPAKEDASNGASSGASAASEAGYYVAASMTYGSSSMSKEELEAEYGTMFLVLNDSGPSYARDARGEISLITWGSGKLTWQDETYSYTLDGNVLTVIDTDSTIVFTRGDGEPPALEETPSKAPVETPAASGAGYYVLTSMNGEDMTSYTTMYLVLNDDGTGYAHSADGETSDITWDLDKITWWGEELYYTLDGGKLTLTEDEGNTLVFTQSNEEPPAKE